LQEDGTPERAPGPWHLTGEGHIMFMCGENDWLENA
jgi:hypothetical protein